MAPDWCFDIPIDHRLKRSLPTKSRMGLGAHRLIYERYGRSLQQKPTRSPRPSDQEIDFGSQLAGPSTRGGLMVTLLQPPRGQRYTGSFEEDTENCATLFYLGDALEMMGSASLKDISCFDAFPFCLERLNFKNPPPEMHAAYETFVEMIRQKKPNVMICAWKAPERSCFTQFSSKGVGAVDDTEVIVVDGHPIKLVNAFHPSYAINYHPNESFFRQLFQLEIAKAFAELDDTWQEGPWMRELRAECRQRASELALLRDSTIQSRCQQRFWFVLENIGDVIRLFNQWVTLGSDENVYDVIVEHQVQRYCCDALLIISISHEYFTVLDKDLKPFPERKSLVSSVGRGCLRLLEHCVRGQSKRSDGSRGFLNSRDIVEMGLPMATATTQLTKGIYGLFTDFLLDLNFCFWPGREQDWIFELAGIKAAFERLAQDLETKLAEMQVETEVNDHASMEILMQAFETTTISN